jgi:hypothetical protein
MDVDTSNAQLVGVNAGDIVILVPKRRMTKDEAIAHAAWLIALADPHKEKFDDVLQAILNS